MKALGQHEVWFFTGSQDLYGDEALRQVAAIAKRVVEALDGASAIPVRIVVRPVLSRRRHRGRHAGGERCRSLHGRDRLDAHLFSREDVDRGL